MVVHRPDPLLDPDVRLGDDDDLGAPLDDRDGEEPVRGLDDDREGDEPDDLEGELVLLD